MTTPTEPENRSAAVRRTLLGHRSIRHFRAVPLTTTEINALLETGLRASSSGNMQTWSVIVTRDPETKEALYEAHRHQQMIREAPVVLTFCADVFRMREWVRVNDSPQSFDDLLGFLTGAVDAAIAAQNVVIAAEAARLGICYMGTTWWAADRLIDLLDLPEHVMPVTSLVVGHPAEQPPRRDRLPLDLIVHHERYRRLTDGEIAAAHAERERRAWDRYTADPETLRRIEALGINKVTDYYTSELKYPKALHRDVSEMLIRTLKRQGLWL